MTSQKKVSESDVDKFLDPKTSIKQFGNSNAAILEFWQWAFSDLKSNDLRGVFAEWLVAEILDIKLTEPRESWAPYDLILPNKKTIEVKSSAYLQTWKQFSNSKIVFTGLKSKILDESTNQYSDSKSYNADIFIFCVQVEKDLEKWDAMELSQWRFYVLIKKQLEKKGTQSIALSVLQKLSKEFTAIELREYLLDKL